MSKQRELIVEQIHNVVDPLIEAGSKIIAPNAVANAVIRSIDPTSLSPHLTAYSATMHIRDVVRSVLRVKIDPVPEDTTKIQDDLFDGLIQQHYPAIRDNDTVYVHVDTMTEEDIDLVCSRMDKAADALKEHVRALRAYFNSKIESATG